jgi:hypothetical protein
MTEQRKEMDGLKQYKARIVNSDGISASSTEFSDWFADDESAKAGFVAILSEQGYAVESVVIGFHCVVTLQ